MRQSSPKTRKPKGGAAVVASRLAPSNKPRRVLIIEDESSVRSMLFAFLTSMECECRATSHHGALGILRHADFDAILVGFAPPRASAGPFLARLRKLRPDLIGKVLVITGGATSAAEINLAESYDLPHVANNLLFQNLWNNLQTLFSDTHDDVHVSPPARRLRLVFDNARPPLLGTIGAGSKAARHLVFKCDNVFVDLLIGPLPKGRAEVVGQILGSPVGKVKLCNLPVVIQGSEPLANSTTNQLGEFRIQFLPRKDLTIRIGLGANSWVEAPLRNMDWIPR
jgi:CheY-like chemotaxis protein